MVIETIPNSSCQQAFHFVSPSGPSQTVCTPNTQARPSKLAGLPGSNDTKPAINIPAINIHIHEIGQRHCPGWLISLIYMHNMQMTRSTKTLPCGTSNCWTCTTEHSKTMNMCTTQTAMVTDQQLVLIIRRNTRGSHLRAPTACVV